MERSGNNNVLGLGFGSDGQQRPQSSTSASGGALPHMYQQYQPSGSGSGQQQQQQQQHYGFYNTINNSGSSSMNVNHLGQTEQLPMIGHASELQPEDLYDHDSHIPQIYEQSASDVDFNDYSHLTSSHPQPVPQGDANSASSGVNMEPQSSSYTANLQHQFSALGMHSPNSTQYSVPLPVPLPGTGTSPHQHQFAHNQSLNYSPNSVMSGSSGSSHHSLSNSPNAPFAGVTPLDIQGLPEFLSPTHPGHHSPYSPTHSHSSQYSSNAPSPASEIYDLSPDQSQFPPAGVRRAISLQGTSATATKSQRRTIEKKSRDKKNAAYERVKKRLEDQSGQSYGGRSQAEVFEGVDRLLVTYGNEHSKLEKLENENRMLKERLKAAGLEVEAR